MVLLCPHVRRIFDFGSNGRGLSCFFVPRWLEDGRRNPIFIQRLKDKLGIGQSSAEIRYHDTEAILIGPAGRGVPNHH